MLTINIKLAIALLGTSKIALGQNWKKTKFQEDKIQQRQNCTNMKLHGGSILHEDTFSQRQICTRGLNCTKTKSKIA